jgi:hypothetical protein
MSVVLRNDDHKYFLDWNKVTNELQLTEWDYVHVGNKSVLQLSATYSVGMGISGSPIYGSWYDTTNQTTTANTPTPMYCNSGSGNGITKVYDSNFEVDYAGTYNIQFSVQLDQTSGAGHHIFIWFRKNGVDIPYSASEVAIQGTLAESIPSWNFIVDMEPGDYINIMYSVTNTNVYLKAVAPNSIPGIPSVIITMWKL